MLLQFPPLMLYQMEMAHVHPVLKGNILRKMVQHLVQHAELGSISLIQVKILVHHVLRVGTLNKILRVINYVLSARVVDMFLLLEVRV